MVTVEFIGCLTFRTFGCAWYARIVSTSSARVSLRKAITWYVAPVRELRAVERMVGAGISFVICGLP
jgi:hypothetical protein